MPSAVSEGLEDVIAGTSTICDVNGREGRLIYRGYDIHDLVEHSTFEETAYLLWHDRLGTRAELDALKAELALHRTLPDGVQQVLRAFPGQGGPMHALRTAVSATALWDPDVADNSPSANHRKSVRLMAQIPTIVTTFHRLRNGREPLPAKSGLSTAGNFLFQLQGKEPDQFTERALDIALILQADHELNASTFAARVTAATLADLHAAVVAGIGALAGPLHGGANQAVFRMFQEIVHVSRAESYIKEKLARHERVMGFGHRVYKTDDPRATHLRELSRQLGERQGDLRWYEISRRIEEVMFREKGLYCNVDFYSASVYDYLDIPTDLYTPLFAVSRITGWTAHIQEQYAHNRLIRPRAEYTGPHNLKYVPIANRAA